MNELAGKVGITVDYIEGKGKDRANLFTALEGVVSTAEREILLLNTYYALDRGIVPEVPERSRYYQAILDRVEAKKHIIYKRVFQFPNPGTAEFSADTVRTPYFEHLKAMVKFQRENPDAKVYLKKTRAFREITFLLVDEVQLCWEVDAISPSGKPYIEGLFLIKDPAKVITRTFKEFFEKVDNDPETRTVAELSRT